MNASDIVYLTYTPHRSMPCNMPATFSMRGGTPVTLVPGDVEDAQGNKGNAVDIARASLLLLGHEKTIALTNESDETKIAAWRAIVAKKAEDKQKKAEKVRKNAAELAKKAAEEAAELEKKQIEESFDAATYKPAVQASRQPTPEPSPVPQELKKDGDSK